VDFKAEMSLLREARDIRDELQTIVMVFQHQQKVFQDFCSMMALEGPPFTVAPRIATLRLRALALGDQASAASRAVRLTPDSNSELDVWKKALLLRSAKLSLADLAC
jgi:hypothetical protein